MVNFKTRQANSLVIEISVSVNGDSEPSEIANLFMKQFPVQYPLGPSLGVLSVRVGPGDSFECVIVKEIVKIIKTLLSPEYGATDKYYT